MISGFKLRRLARRYGIQLSYEDAAGKIRRASDESLIAILKCRIPEGMSFEEALRRKKPDRQESLSSTRAPAPASKTWGIFVPVYAMHRPDLGELQRYQQWVRELGGSFVATLPLNALDDDERSPYAPTSRLFWNEQYLDVERLPEYRGEKGPKREILQTLSRRWQAPNDIDPLLVEYSRFRAHVIPSVSEGPGRAGDAKNLHSRAAPPPRSLADARDDMARFHLYAQTRMSEQMSQLEAMYLDFPLGVKAGGFDHTHFADHFAKGVSVGAPPDLVFTKGQNWGFPPPNPDADLSYFRACIRKAVQHASILRIDHVMGLHRLFWIPDGAEPKDGVYVRYPSEELYAVLMSEAARTGTVIVGEDLGTVPQYVPQAMNRHGIRRMYVVQYELPKLNAPPRESIASVNTHDMPTFAGFWRGKDIDERVERDLLDENGAEKERQNREKVRAKLIKFLKARRLLTEAESETMAKTPGAARSQPRRSEHVRRGSSLCSELTVAVHEGLARWLASSDAEFVLINLEDCWLEEEPQNRPGMPERSWRRKMRKSLEEARSDRAVTRLLKAVNEERHGK